MRHRYTPDDVKCVTMGMQFVHTLLLKGPIIGCQFIGCIYIYIPVCFHGDVFYSFVAGVCSVVPMCGLFGSVVRCLCMRGRGGLGGGGGGWKAVEYHVLFGSVCVSRGNGGGW